MPINNIITAGDPIDPTVDPFYAQTILILNNDGASGSNVWTDKSPKNRTINKVGSPTIDGANGINVSSGNCLQLPASADFIFNADFCIEYFLTSALAGTRDHINCGDMSASTHWTMLNSNAQIQMYPQGAGSYTGKVTAANTRHHLAMYRIGTTCYLAIDGVITNTAVVYSGNIGNSANPLSIGSRMGTGNFVDGVIGPVRITKGNARYPAASFTPPDFGPFQIKG